jgi:chromosome segregation and condensation protein ScpB
MTNMSRFSLSAYEDLRDAGELSRQERIVFDTITLHGPMTREEIEAATGLRLASVFGRVAALIGKGVCVEVGEKKNLTTGKANGLIDISLAEIDARTSPSLADSAASREEGSAIAQGA